jgi:hypothetical protein
LTLGAKTFFCPVPFDLALTGWRTPAFFVTFAVFFFGEIAGRFDKDLFAALPLDTVDLAPFRVEDFDAAALFAFGRAGFAFTERPLTDDFAEDRRTGARDVVRRNPFVMGLLITSV